MATVDKNFKVKHGLVVEGNTATVNGSDVITANAIAGGTQNNITVNYDANSKTLNFSVDALQIDTQGPLTYNNGTLDLSTGQGLGIGGNGELLVDTNTVANLIAGTGLYPAGGGEIAVSDQFIIDTVEAANTLTLGGDLTLGGNLYNSTGNKIYNDGSNTFGDGSYGSVFQGSQIDLGGYNTILGNTANLSITSQGAVSISGFGMDIYTNAGDASVRSLEGNVFLDAVGGVYIGSSSSIAGNQVATKGYADEAAANAITSAQSYTDSRINDGVTSNVKTWSSTKINSEISTAVSGLVDGAPELLNTLNELAAAIADNPNYATDVANLVGTKQDSFTAADGLAFDTVANSLVLKVNVDGNTLGIAGDALYVDTNVMATVGYVDTVASGKQATFTAGNGLEFTANNTNLQVVVDSNTLTISGDQLQVVTNVIATIDYVDTNFVNINDLPGQLDDYVPLTQKGANDGVATLDSTGDVPASQLGNQFITDVTDNLYMAGKTLRMYSDPSFTDVRLQTYAKLMSNTNDLTVAGGQEELFNMYTGEYDSAEIVIKARKSDWSDRHMTKILVTCDGSGNVAITEYGSISTNQDLFTVEATGESWGPNHVVRIKVTPLASINVKWYAEQIGA